MSRDRSVPRVTRRDFLAAAAAAAAAGKFVGPAMGQDANTVHLGTFGGVFESAYKSLAPALKSETGLELTLSIGSSQLTRTKLEAASGRSPFDAVMMGPEAVLMVAKQNLLTPISERNVPNIGKIQKRLLAPYRIEGGYAAAPLHWKAIGIIWRKDLVPFEITSWHDLWRPELRNRISVQNMPTLGGALVLIVAATVNGGSQRNLEPGWKALKTLRPNIREFYAVTSNALTSLVAGDTWASINTLDLGLPLSAKGIVATIPKEGITYVPEGIAIPKGSRNEAGALRFLNFMLEDKNQVAWARNARVAPSTSVAVPADVKQDLIESDALLDKLIEVDFLDMGENIRSWADRWRREVVE